MTIKLALAAFLVTGSFAAAQAPAASASALTNQLRAVMKAAEAKGFSGVVRVEKDRKTLLESGYGLANRGSRISFTPNTVVQIGSNTKDFTAVAILQLQERGLLSVNDPISKYFRGVPADKARITIWQLITHRAGFPIGVGGDFEAITRPQLVDRAMQTPLQFTPGSKEGYSNTGYSILAAIIENLFGKSYDVYVRDNILEPLGLHHTGFLLPHFSPRDEAHGYQANGADYGTMLSKPHATDGPYWNLRGNGGMLSTVGDMHAFYHALFETDKLLKSQTRALRFDPNKPIGLAGSDLISFFLYERDPIAHTEMIIASNNAAAKAPMIRREIGRVLGLPSLDGEGPAVSSVSAPASAAPAAVSEVITAFFDVLNSGNTQALTTFIAAHFANDPGAPALDDRVQRISQMHSNQGKMTIKRIRAAETGPVEVSISTAANGDATVRVMIDRSPPYLIHRLMIMVGGD